MKGLSVLPDNPNHEPEGHVQTGDDGERFAVVELDGLPGWANLNLGALTVEQQRRYLLALASVAERLVFELDETREGGV